MAGSPKNIELKMQRMLNAWETLAPDKIFAGMTRKRKPQTTT